MAIDGVGPCDQEGCRIGIMGFLAAHLRSEKSQSLQGLSGRLLYVINVRNKVDKEMSTLLIDPVVNPSGFKPASLGPRLLLGVNSRFSTPEVACYIIPILLLLQSSCVLTHAIGNLLKFGSPGQLLKLCAACS